MREMKNAFNILVVKPEGNSPLGRRRRRREDNIKRDRKERLLKIMDWIYLTQDCDRWWALVNTVVLVFS
jgi:hypothetical protein